MNNRHAVAICCGLVIILCISGCATRCMSPKERSYALALGVLKNPRQADTYQKIESMKDVDALRIIAFTAESAAWRMDAGPDVEFDNQLHEIALAAIHRLFIFDSEIAREVIADYKKAFVVDGSVSLLFRQWEEERKALQSQWSCQDSKASVSSNPKIKNGLQREGRR